MTNINKSNNLFLQESFQPIENLDDLQSYTENIAICKKNITDLCGTLNTCIYSGTFVGIWLFISAIVLPFGNHRWEDYITGYMVSIIPALLGIAVLSIIEEATDSFSWRKKLNLWTLNLFSGFKKNNHSKILLNKNLHDCLLNKKIEKQLILMLTNILNERKKMNKPFEYINLDKNKLIAYFANKNYTAAEIWINKNFEYWKNEDANILEEIKSNNEYNDYMSKVEIFSKKNKLTYLEKEISLGDSSYNL